ncbi:MAG: twin-arginine translocase TatA/TatE family subunit [Nocardioides sp.]
MYSLIAMPQGAEWLVILAIVILVFGAAKLPDLARGTGQALRIFKAETKGLKDDDKDDEGPGAPAELPPTSLAEETKSDSPIVGEPHPDQRG